MQTFDFIPRFLSPFFLLSIQYTSISSKRANLFLVLFFLVIRVRCSIINAYGGCINCIIVNDSPVRHFSIKWASCFKISFGWETIRESALSRPSVKLYSLNWLAQERKIVYLTALMLTKDHMFLKKKDARSINECKIPH